jgi:uncharacterized protein (DUF433 family)
LLAKAVSGIVVNPRIMGGKPATREAGMPVYFILELLSNEWSIDDIVGVYPSLTEDDVLAAIGYATKVLRGEGYC